MVSKLRSLYEPMKEKNNKSNHVTIRLTDAEYEPFRLAMEAMGKRKSEYFRMHLTGKLTAVMPNEANKKELKELIRLFNKTSNNMNQIAKRFNTLAKDGVITERQALLCLNSLNRISENMLNGIDYVSKD